MDLLFVILYFTIPLIVIFILKLAGIKLFDLTIPSFVIIALLAFAYSGYIVLYFGLDSYRVSIGIQDKYIVFQAFVFSAWTILSVALGYLYSTKVLKLNVDTHLNPRSFTKKEKVIGFLFILLCIFILLVYLSKVPKIAFFVALVDGFTEAKFTRSLMGNDFADYHRYRWIIRDLYIIITLAFYANWLITKKRFDFFIFLFSFIGLSFSLVMATEKAPMAWFIIEMFFVYCLVNKKGKLPIKQMFIVISIVIGILILFYIYFMGSKDAFSAFTSMLSRVFAGGITPSYLYLEFFPKEQDFLLGRSFPNPGGILPYEPYRLTVEVHNYFFPQDLEKGIVGTNPTVFWGELYANFGVFGVLIYPFFVGIMIYIIATFFNKFENNPYKIGFLVWLILHYRDISVTGISGFIIDITLVVMIIFAIVFMSLSHNFKIKYYRRLQNG